MEIHFDLMEGLIKSEEVTHNLSNISCGAVTECVRTVQGEGQGGKR